MELDFDAAFAPSGDESQRSGADADQSPPHSRHASPVHTAQPPPPPPPPAPAPVQLPPPPSSHLPLTVGAVV